MAGCAVIFMISAIATDTAFYRGPVSTTSFRALYKALRSAPVITPWNNIRYNSQTANLAIHGLHSRHQHFLVNLPQLLGPVLILLFTSLQPFSTRNLRSAISNRRLLSALTGTLLLSIFPHQEQRFLLPCVPLLLSCVRLPSSSRGRKWFWLSWLSFNILFGTLMGVYHQGGVIPAQLQVPEQIKVDSALTSSDAANATVFWWKTYPPPTYLLGRAQNNISTVTLMGRPQREMVSELSSALPCTNNDITTSQTAQSQLIYLIAPLSSHFFPQPEVAPNRSFTTTPPSGNNNTTTAPLKLTLQWQYRRHINLDDMDIGEDGIWATGKRVLGRRGIGLWQVHRLCPST